jgi:hypothetical protein
LQRRQSQCLSRLHFSQTNQSKREISARLAHCPATPNSWIDALLPASVPAGGPTFQLTIVGQNFSPATQAKLNGMNRPTTFVSDSELRVTVYASDTPIHPDATSVGTSVHNPAPGGGAAVRDLIILQAANANPVPAIARLVPQSMPVGSGDHQAVQDLLEKALAIQRQVDPTGLT